MAMDNKWKKSAGTGSSGKSGGDISFEEVIEGSGESASPLSQRSDWTMQRKVGVAMGVVGALLFVVGLAPLVLDSNSLKGNLTGDEKTQETSADPLAALLAGSAEDSKMGGTKEPSDTKNSKGENNLPDDLKSFGAQDGQGQNLNTGEKVVVPTPEALFAGAADTSSTTGYTAPKYDPMTAEVDQILSAETVNAGLNANPAPIATPVAIVATNTNIGTSDTTGSAFANQGGTVTAAMNAQNTSAGNFHNSAGLNTSSTTVKNKNLTNSGPADTALLVFLLSLFIAGGIRYRKELL